MSKRTNKRVYRVQSICTLLSGAVVESTDCVAVDGGMITAARKVEDYLLGMRFRDPNNGEWSDVTDARAQYAQELCELNVK